MSELDDIKKRAAARPKEQDWTMYSSCDEYRCQCHNDLDRAIAIAEERLDPVDVGKSIGYLMADVEKARAAALALRDVVKRQVYWRSSPEDGMPLLADTEWLEAHRDATG